jgi:molybdate transport system ATP-binding protein
MDFAAKSAMKLRLGNVHLPLAPFALEVNLVLERQVTAFFGHSGAGKTSLLDLVAGLRKPLSAFIELNGRILADTQRGTHVPARERRLGYVPQDLALFPHLNVRKNLLYGYAHRHETPLFSFEQVIKLLEIEPLIDRPVTLLSGGEKQRVTLARALLASPQLLLLDEPLASLDTQLKAKVIPYFQRIRDELRLPILYVTHDANEAAAIAEEVIVITQGRVVSRGTPQHVFRKEHHDCLVLPE